MALAPPSPNTTDAPVCAIAVSNSPASSIEARDCARRSISIAMTSSDVAPRTPETRPRMASASS